MRGTLTLSVLGAGTMGHGIAQVASLADYNVILCDINEELVQKGYDQIEWSLDKLIERGELTDDEASDAVDSDLEKRFVAVMANEVGKLIESDVAPVVDIDRAMELGAGSPDGPAAMAEEYGIERQVETLERLHSQTDSPRYDPSPYPVSLAEQDASFWADE